MPANTARGFPYPLPTEPVAEGAQAIRNLAEAVDAKTAGDLIQAIVLSTPGTLTFSAIPQTFRTLVLVASLKSPATGPAPGYDEVMLRLNGSSAAVYSSQWSWASGATLSASNALNAPWAPVAFCPEAGTPALVYGALRLEIPAYALVQWPTWFADSYSPGANYRAQHGGISGATPTAAVTSLQLLSSRGASNAFVAGSRASLYGMR